MVCWPSRPSGFSEFSFSFSISGFNADDGIINRFDENLYQVRILAVVLESSYSKIAFFERAIRKI